LDKSSLFGIWWRKDITEERAVEPIEHRAAGCGGGERGWVGGLFLLCFIIIIL